MDKKQTIGFVLIGLIIAAYMTFMSIRTQQQQTAKQQQDSIAQAKQQEVQTAAQSQPNASTTATQQGQPPQTQVQQAQQPPVARYGALFDQHLQGTEQRITIENDLVQATLSSRGASLLAWKLKNFKAWYGDTTQLISYDNPRGELGVFFTTNESKEVDTRELFFTLSTANGQPVSPVMKLSGNDSLTLIATLTLSNGDAIKKELTFYGNRYDIGIGVTLTGLQNVLANRRYEVAWKGGLQYQEQSSVDESNYGKAMLSQNRTVEELDATDIGTPVKTSGSGIIDYAAIKSKYFLTALLPRTNNNGETTVYLDGERRGAPNEGALEHYAMTFRMPYRTSGQTDRFTAYIGPIDYKIVSGYGLEATVDFGWKFIVRPIGEYLMLPFLKFIHNNIVANYGFAIIIFSIFLKILMHPLTSSQMQASMKMQLLAPEMEKIRTKYKDDMQLQQQETMRLYSEYGINPAGGCLPLLLQMPILYAMNNVMNTTIDLRQTPFVAWITDLSMPDVMVRLPFKIPLFSVDIISGLALSMGLTMFVQQKMTITDPRQKSMVYVMPVMFTMLFSNFASGLNLYYFMFNLLSIAHQTYLTKFSKNKLTLADLKKAPKKEGWLQKKMREAQDIAASQGRTLPGQPPSSQRSNDKGNKKK